MKLSKLMDEHCVKYELNKFKWLYNTLGNVTMLTEQSNRQYKAITELDTVYTITTDKLEENLQIEAYQFITIHDRISSTVIGKMIKTYNLAAERGLISSDQIKMEKAALRMIKNSQYGIIPVDEIRENGIKVHQDYEKRLGTWQHKVDVLTGDFERHAFRYSIPAGLGKRGNTFPVEEIQKRLDYLKEQELLLIINI